MKKEKEKKQAVNSNRIKMGLQEEDLDEGTKEYMLIIKNLENSKSRESQLKQEYDELVAKLRVVNPQSTLQIKEKIVEYDAQIKEEHLMIRQRNENIKDFCRQDFDKIEHEKERKKVQKEDELTRMEKRIDLLLDSKKRTRETKKTIGEKYKKV